MILTQDKTNVTAPNSEYPFGQIRDRDGVIPGTPGSLEVYGDHHQFFEKLIRESTIIPNGLLDSEYNGYQLWAAFEEHVKNLRNYTRYYIVVSQSGTSAPTINQQLEADFGAPTLVNRTATGRYNFFFTGSPIDLTGKTVIMCNANWDGWAEIDTPANNEFRLFTKNSAGTNTDSLLSSTFIQIKVYD